MSGRESAVGPAIGAAGERDAASAAPADGATLLDDALWERLDEAQGPEDFVAAWLDLACRIVGGVRRAVVVLGPADAGPFRPVGWWPVGVAGPGPLDGAAEEAMAGRGGVVRRDTGAGIDVLAWPLLVDEQLCGVVAMELDARAPALLRAATRQLQWSCGWLDALVRRGSFATKSRLVTVLDLLAVALEPPGLRASATAFATELATALGCDWAAVGLRDDAHAEVAALSHSAEFGARSNLVRAIGAAMDEAIDRQSALVHPSPAGGPPLSARAHAELAGQRGIGALCTVPMSEGRRVVGAITLARRADEPFTAAELDLCRQLAGLAGPVLASRAREDRWIGRKVRDAAGAWIAGLVGPEHARRKVWVAALVLLAAVLAVARTEYRVSADASLEGTVQRVVAAPIDGFVAEAPHRAGDLVEAGDLLAVLDDRDLKLERLRWVNQHEQRRREYNRALAEHDSAQVRILGAQLRQAEARMALIDEELARTRVRAPFDGVVVAGDLSQSLDAPVERGERLFEIAPLDSYRVALDVDERDVAQLRVGQTGELALSGLPGRTFAMTVTGITPVSTTEEGRNFFRVEAALDEGARSARPGMEGVGKVSVGTRRLVWIWTHELVYWLKLWLWTLW